MHKNWLPVVVVLIVAASMGGAAAQAQDTPVTPPAPVPPVAAPAPSASVPAPAMAANPNNVSDPMAVQDPDQIICVKEKLTGSMLPTTVCQTRRNWIKQGTNSRDRIGHAQNVGSGQPRGD
jgi:hypothetical protein